MDLCGFGIHAFYRARDIKEDWNNHRHPATTKDKILSPKERVTKWSIPPSHPPIVYVGCGVAWYLVAVFNEGHLS